LSHEGSDLDIYEVVSDRWGTKAHCCKQSILGGVDKTTVSLSTFIEQAQQGHPQALEAMYSTKADVDMIYSLRSSFVANPYLMESKYTRLIRYLDINKPKQLRHAIRLSMNLETYKANQRFNPTLTLKQVSMLTRLVEAGRLY
jgi:hypothetical protein